MRPRIHDVGCGVGYFVKTCVDLGYPAQGNDLNRYAVSRMRELFKLDVYHGTLANLVSCLPQADIVISSDMIEHVFDPLEEFRAAHELLKPNGIFSIRTFAIDSNLCRRLGKNWSMFSWSHTYHFSSKTLADLFRVSMFAIESVSVSRGGSLEVIGRKK